VRKLITPKTVFALRWFLTVLAVLSLCAWVFTWRWRLGVSVRMGDYVGIARGCFVMSYEYGLAWAEDAGEPRFWLDRVHPNIQLLHWGSLEWGYPHSSIAVFSLAVPLWALALAFGMPAAWLWVKRRKLLPTDCQKCGYDLRGLASGTCPECGHAPAAAHTKGKQ